MPYGTTACEECGSTKTRYTATPGVMKCDECGEYFEPDDQPVMAKRIPKMRPHDDDD